MYDCRINRDMLLAPPLICMYDESMHGCMAAISTDTCSLRPPGICSLCVHVYDICACVCVCVCVCVCACRHVYMTPSRPELNPVLLNYVCMRVCMYASMCCSYVNKYMHVSINVYMYVYIHKHTYIGICTRPYTHAHAHAHTNTCKHIPTNIGTDICTDTDTGT